MGRPACIATLACGPTLCPHYRGRDVRSPNAVTETGNVLSKSAQNRRSNHLFHLSRVVRPLLEPSGASDCQNMLLRPVGRVTIVVPPTMYIRALVLLVAVMAVAAPSFAATEVRVDVRDEAKAQVEFGIKVAQQGLWKEATYRWEKATEIDPTYAEAWNNLAIGYEHEGRFEDADKAYQQALKLAPKNVAIRTNYDLFKEINERTKRRRDR